MRKAFKHTGVLLMAAVVGLSIIGAAYALWFENLHLTATVATGTFNVDWSCDTPSTSAPGGLTSTSANGLCGDAAAKPVVYVYGCAVGFNDCTVDSPHTTLVDGQIPAGKKPVCTATIGASGAAGDVQTGSPAADANTLSLFLGSNANNPAGVYPFAGCEFLIDIHNSGSVPAHFERIANCTRVGDGACAGDLMLVVTNGVWFGTRSALLTCPTRRPLAEPSSS